MLDTMPTILIAAADAGKAVTEAGGGPEESVMYWPLIWVCQAGVGILVLGILLCMWRMIRGPHLADRVLAGDTFAMLVAGLVVLIAVMYDSAIFYDAALVVAVLGFASTVAFSQYIGAKNKHAQDPDQSDTQSEGGAA